jgi:hypothetical protein
MHYKNSYLENYFLGIAPKTINNTWKGEHKYTDEKEAIQ